MPSVNPENIKFFLKNGEPDESEDFTDLSSSAHTITPFGDVHHEADVYAFPPTSILFNGGGDRLTVGPSDDFALPSSVSWTIVSRYYPLARLQIAERIWQLGTGWTTGVVTLLDRYISYPTKFSVLGYDFPGNTMLVSSTTITEDTEFYLIEVGYDAAADTYYLFVDGDLEDTVSGTLNINPSHKTFTVGMDPSGETVTQLNGYIHECFFNRGSILNTVSYTPPATAYTLGAGGAEICLMQEQAIATRFSLPVTQFLSMAPVLNHASTQILAKARQTRLLHEQSMDTTTPIWLHNEQVLQGLAQVALTVTQVMRCYGAPVAMEMLQAWASYDYNLVFLPVVQMLGSQLDTVLQELQFSVTVAGQRVGITDCQFDRKGFANFATLMLRKRGDWSNKNPGDPVVLTVLGEQYQLIVINKPQDEQIGQGSYEVGYVLECASITAQLSEGLNPDIAASRITASFASGTWLTEILDLLTDGVCAYSLAVPDFMVGAYDFDDVQRYDAMREVLPIDYGWIIKTDQAGVLQLSQWARPEVGGAGQKTLTMSRKSLTPPQDTLYTEVRIYNFNQQDNTSGLILETEDNGDGTGTIYGYSVPWTEAFAIYDSEDASAPSLLFDGGDVEEVDVEDTDVEFVDSAASLSKPCYSDPVIDWGQNDSLSPVSYTEAGALSTEIEPGYSVAVSASYGTRRKVWTFDNKKVDITQIRLKYDATN